MSTATTEGVHALAETIAREIAARQGGEAPLDVTATSMSGSFTLAIKYDTTVYTLTVTIPAGEGGEYVFELQATVGEGKPEDIASFKYKDGDNWKIAAGLPQPISFGSITIETLQLAFGSGTV